jgi:hypothetical protein
MDVWMHVFLLNTYVDVRLRKGTYLSGIGRTYGPAGKIRRAAESFLREEDDGAKRRSRETASPSAGEGREKQAIAEGGNQKRREEKAEQQEGKEKSEEGKEKGRAS